MSLEFVARSKKVAEDKLLSCRSQQEMWKASHDEAMEVFNVQDLVGDLIELFTAIRNLDRKYTAFIRNAPNAYCFDFDESLKDLYREFLAVARDTLDMVSDHEERDWQVERASDLRSIVDQMELAEKQDFDGVSLAESKRMVPDVATLRQLAAME